MTYLPSKQLISPFFDQLANNIDNVITENEKLFLVGDYINYLMDNEKNLETVLIPYYLNVQNKTVPTRVNKSSNGDSLIVYVISDNCDEKKIVIIL